MLAPTVIRPLAADILAEAGLMKKSQARAVAAPAVQPLSQPVSSRSKEEIDFRAYFLSMAIANNHRMKLIELYDRCGIDPSSPEARRKLTAAGKILCCASLFLIGLERGGVAGGRDTLDLLMASFMVVEKMSPEHPVRAVVSTLGQCDKTALVNLVQTLIVKALELPICAIKVFSEIYSTEDIYRQEISNFAWQQAPAVLQDHLALFFDVQSQS